MIKGRDVSTGATGTISVASKQGGRFCTSLQRLHQGFPVVTSLIGQYISKLVVLTSVQDVCVFMSLSHDMLEHTDTH